MSWEISCASFDTAAAQLHSSGRISVENTLDVRNFGWIMVNSMIEFIKC